MRAADGERQDQVDAERLRLRRDVAETGADDGAVLAAALQLAAQLDPDAAAVGVDAVVDRDGLPGRSFLFLDDQEGREVCRIVAEGDGLVEDELQLARRVDAVDRAEDQQPVADVGDSLVVMSDKRGR